MMRCRPKKARRLAQEFLGKVAGGADPIAEKAAARLDRGDGEEHLVWRRIRRAIEALQAEPPDKPH
jgi:hypothetical protein